MFWAWRSAASCSLRSAGCRPLLVGGIVAAASNLLYADLALGGPWIDGFAHLFFLDHIGIDPRMIRLMLAISGENIAGGLAGTAVHRLHLLDHVARI